MTATPTNAEPETTELSPEATRTPPTSAQQHADWIAQRIKFDDAANLLRTQWGIQEPELHKMPRWLRPAVNTAIRAGMLPPAHYSLDGWSALYHAARAAGGDRWLDHQGRIELADGSQVLVSEPYNFSDEDRGHVAEFCRVLGLSYTVSDQSWWYPGRTIRLTISQTAKDQADEQTKNVSDRNRVQCSPGSVAGREGN